MDMSYVFLLNRWFSGGVLEHCERLRDVCLELGLCDRFRDILLKLGLCERIRDVLLGYFVLCLRLSSRFREVLRFRFWSFERLRSARVLISLLVLCSRDLLELLVLGDRRRDFFLDLFLDGFWASNFFSSDLIVFCCDSTMFRNARISLFW